MVPAPGRFSITTDWPFQRAESRSARMRATTSVGPPAANGTRIFTGLVGKSMPACADALDAATASSSALSMARTVVARSIAMAFLSPLNVLAIWLARMRAQEEGRCPREHVKAERPGRLLRGATQELTRIAYSR